MRWLRGELQFFCFRFALGLNARVFLFLAVKRFNSSVLDSKAFELVLDAFKSLGLNPSFNSSVLDSDSWFYLPLYKFFPALFMVFVRGFIPLVDARFVKPLTV